MEFLRTLSRTVSLMNLPFGYTLTVWSSGNIAVSRFGTPSFLEILLFLIGAISAYLICAVLAHRELGQAITIRMRALTAINIFAVIAAAAVSLVSSLSHSPGLGYAISGFVGTLTYILCITSLLYWASRLERPEE